MKLITFTVALVNQPSKKELLPYRIKQLSMNRIIILSFFGTILSCSGTEGSTKNESSQEIVVSDSIEVVEDINEALFPEEGDCYSEMRVYLNDPDTTGTNIRSSPGGEVVGTIKNGEFDDCIPYFMMAREAKDGWIKIDNNIECITRGLSFNDGGECWIHGSVISVKTPSDVGSGIDLFANTSEDAEIVATISRGSEGLHLLDMCADWIKVSYDDNGTKIEGWTRSFLMKAISPGVGI
jgi:hypothetical protein